MKTTLLARIENDFTYHAPAGNQAERYNMLRMHARDFGLLLVDTCPESRELSLALTKLEETIFWANASIARNEE